MAVTSGKAVEGSPKHLEIQQSFQKLSTIWLCFEFADLGRRATKRPSLEVMKHRHSFFINSSKQPSPDSFSIVSGEKGQPSVLKIRKLAAAREWKITIDTDDLDAEVEISI
jgi:hypothetical protein